MSERERLAERLREIARPGGPGDRPRILAYALEYGSETLSDDEAFTEAERLLGENGRGPTKRGRRLSLTPAGQIRSERVRWLDPGRIPLRGVTVTAGEKGLGKSIFTNAYLAAKVTRGELEGELQEQPADVLIATAEDDWASVIKPRLMAHGADLDRVHRVQILDQAGEALLTLPEDVTALEAEVERLRSEGRPVAMLVIDPIGAFLGESIDSHKEVDVRRGLAPLAKMAERLDLAVVVVAHLTKDDSKRLIQRVSGASAFVNAARSVLAFARDPDDSEGEQGRDRVLVHVASNWGRYAPSLGARIESRDVDVDDGSRSEVGCLVITGESSVNVGDLQRGFDEDGSDCEERIGQELKDGRKPSYEVKAKVASELGCSRKTVERAGVRMEKDGRMTIEAEDFPRKTFWELLLEDSGDSGDNDAGDTEGTALGAARVPTGETASESGKPPPGGDSRDSGDSPQPQERVWDYTGEGPT